MIVVDTNILCYFYLTSEHSTSAEKLFSREPDWNAPLLWRSEFRNILAFYMKKGRPSLTDAIEIYSTAEQLLRGKEFEVNSEHVLELSQSSGCSAYDCEFVSLALDLGTKLVTMDKQLMKAFPETAVSIQDYIDFSSSGSSTP